MKKISCTIIGILALILGTTLASTDVASPNSTTATIYINPPTITAATVGQTFTVEIRVSNVTNLRGLTIGLTWDPTVLELNISGPHNGFGFGPFLGTPMVDYIPIPGEINNTAGETTRPYGASRFFEKGGVNGSGILVYIDLVAKAIGTFSVHIADTSFYDLYVVAIPTNIVDIFPVTWDTGIYTVIILNNLTGVPARITNHIFNQGNKNISFNVTSPPDTTCFCNVTIPKALLRDNTTHPWTVLVDSTSITYIEVENTTHSSLYFAYIFDTRKVQINGAEVIPEFPLAIILPMLITITLAIALLRKTIQSTKRKGPLVSNVS